MYDDMGDQRAQSVHSPSQAPQIHSRPPLSRGYSDATQDSYSCSNHTFAREDSRTDSRYDERPSRASLPSNSDSDEVIVSSYEPEPVKTEMEMTRIAPIRSTIPASSREFSDLFPSSRRLLIHHDDATMDGNMNLRVDTRVKTTIGRDLDLTLFHLRMYDLKTRDFSIRRYCRDSGKEVCHSTSKNQKHTTGKTKHGLQRSLSSALHAIKSMTDVRHAQQPSPPLIRQDSGYESMGDEDADEDEEAARPSSSHSGKSSAGPTSDVIRVEFSNYAHLDMKRHGYKADKRYDFHYWGDNYAWQKNTLKMGRARELSYHLIRRSDNSVVARIVPEPLSNEAAREEIDAGGWIPPCTMVITDERIIERDGTDVADVVVSTGLLALVDDSIRRRFHSQETKQLITPFSNLHPFKHFKLPTIAKPHIEHLGEEPQRVYAAR